MKNSKTTTVAVVMAIVTGALTVLSVTGVLNTEQAAAIGAAINSVLAAFGFKLAADAPKEQ